MKIKLKYSGSCDINYAARLIALEESDFIPHPNASKLKLAKVLGFKVIIDIKATPGEYVFFPAGSQISGSFLSYASEFHDSAKNKENRSGTFENSGRVKAIKLRGEISEGWLCKLDTIKSWIYYDLIGSSDADFDYGTGTFDTIELGKTKDIWVCRKYVVKGDPGTKKQRFRGKVPAHIERVPKDQFKFHYETELLKLFPWVIKPKSYIWITKKVDGTSGISSYTQIKRKWYEVWKPKRYYHRLYSSSGVIRSKEINGKVGPGWYGVDIWKEADKVVGPKLDRGMTAYYEIVGYLPTGEFIQKEDDFGCTKPEGSFKVGTNFRVLIYRLTITTPEGTIMEMNPSEVRSWAESKGLESVKLLWEGLAMDRYPDLSPEIHFSENFVNRLSEDHGLGMEEDEDECRNKVPQEGIVIRVGNKAYKLKTNAHLLWKQEWIDKEVIDIEDYEKESSL